MHILRMKTSLMSIGNGDFAKNLDWIQIHKQITNKIEHEAGSGVDNNFHILIKNIMRNEIFYESYEKHGIWIIPN